MNEFNLASWGPWLTYDAIRINDDLTDTPVTIVHSEAAAIPQGARTFFDRLQGEKSQLWLEGVTQFDFYDQDAAVTQAVNAVDTHFSQTLQ